MKKPPSKLKQIAREAQLILCVGALLLIVYAVVNSSLAFAISGVLSPQPGALGAILGLLVRHATMLVLAPAICFGVRRVIEVDPARLGYGSALFAQLPLFLLMRWTGGMEDTPVLAVVESLAAALLAGTFAFLAARKAAAIMAATESKQAAAQASARPPAPDLAEQMRQAQQAARAQPAPPPDAPKS